MAHISARLDILALCKKWCIVTNVPTFSARNGRSSFWTWAFYKQCSIHNHLSLTFSNWQNKSGSSIFRGSDNSVIMMFSLNKKLKWISVSSQHCGWSYLGKYRFHFNIGCGYLCSFTRGNLGGYDVIMFVVWENTPPPPYCERNVLIDKSFCCSIIKPVVFLSLLGIIENTFESMFRSTPVSINSQREIPILALSHPRFNSCYLRFVNPVNFKPNWT